MWIFTASTINLTNVLLGSSKLQYFDAHITKIQIYTLLYIYNILMWKCWSIQFHHRFMITNGFMLTLSAYVCILFIEKTTGLQINYWRTLLTYQMVTNHNELPSISVFLSKFYLYSIPCVWNGHHFRDNSFHNKSNVDYEYKEKRSKVCACVCVRERGNI